jgi:hypothetical protein
VAVPGARFWMKTSALAMMSCSNARSLGAFEIEGERLLATIEPDEVGTLSLNECVVTAGEVALRPLDIDDARTCIRQTSRSIGSSNGLL